MEECIYYTQAGYGWCVSGYGCCVSGIVGGFDARSVLVLRMYAWRVILCLKRWASMTFKDHPISKRIFVFCAKNWMTLVFARKIGWLGHGLSGGCFELLRACVVGMRAHWRWWFCHGRCKLHVHVYRVPRGRRASNVLLFAMHPWRWLWMILHPLQCTQVWICVNV
jgi:hypothetical protein